MIDDGMRAARGIVFGTLVGTALILFALAAAFALVDLEWVGADLLVIALVIIIVAVGIEHGPID